MSAQVLIRRILTCLAGVTILLGCQPTASKDISTHHSSQISETQNYDIVGFSPIEAIIPDWDEVRKKPWVSYHIGNDGARKKGSTGGPDRFLCEDAEERYFNLNTIDPDNLMPFEVIDREKTYASVLPELRKHLDAIREVTPVDGMRDDYQENLRLVRGTMMIRDILTFDDGWLVSSSYGEFGGMLLWVKRNGRYEIIDESNANDLLLHDGVIYSAHGVNHFGVHSPYILAIEKTWRGFKTRKIAAPSAVMKIAAQGDRLIGLLDDGLVFVNGGGAVHTKRFPHTDSLGFRPEQIGFLPSGDVYVAGKNVIGIYRGLPDITRPDLYIPNDCILIFEKTIDLWDK